jgi:uncharacterized repeat protein (TIGR03803 family)
MGISNLRRYALVGASVALLAGCGGSQPPVRVSPQGLSPQLPLARQAYHILHSFGKSAEDGSNPSSDLINVKGTFYGTTTYGGAHNSGTVFSITKSGEERVLYSFGPGDGCCPVAPLLNVNGMLYGTAAGGGTYGGGTVFKVTLDGKETVLHNFDSDYYSYDTNSGSVPVAGLINVNGILYGTTERGGLGYCGVAHSCGTVFSITTAGTYKVLHKFGKHDGAYPEAALLDLNGTLYGTTFYGGSGNAGTVFSITTTGEEHKVYSFGTNSRDGGYPAAALIAVGGTLYGTASGGLAGGAVFSVAPNGTEKTIYNLGGNSGSQPLAALIDVKGVLYGTTAMGGVKNIGTVFSVTTNGEEKVLHSFFAENGSPLAGLLEVGGTLYGTTFSAIRHHPGPGHGNVFSLTP